MKTSIDFLADRVILEYPQRVDFFITIKWRINMTKGPSLQDPFLNTLRKEKVPVSIYLVNGIKLQGLIESFDQFVVLLKNTVSQMVYKHAISTVVPARNVSSPMDYHTTNGGSSNGGTHGNGNNGQHAPKE